MIAQSASTCVDKFSNFFVYTMSLNRYLLQIMTAYFALEVAAIGFLG
jgi:hypothetical protein